MSNLRERWRAALEKHFACAKTFEGPFGTSDVSVYVIVGMKDREIAAATEGSLEEAMEECLRQLRRKRELSDEQTLD